MISFYDQGKAEGSRWNDQFMKQHGFRNAQACLDYRVKLHQEEFSAIAEMYAYAPEYAISHAAFFLGLIVGERAVLKGLIERSKKSRSQKTRSDDIETIIADMKQTVQQTGTCSPQVFGLGKRAQVRCHLTRHHSALYQAGETCYETLGTDLQVLIAVRTVKEQTMLVTEEGKSVSLGAGKDLLTFVIVDRRQQTEEVSAYELITEQQRVILTPREHPPTSGQIWEQAFPSLVELGFRGRFQFLS